PPTRLDSRPRDCGPPRAHRATPGRRASGGTHPRRLRAPPPRSAKIRTPNPGADGPVRWSARGSRPLPRREEPRHECERVTHAAPPRVSGFPRGATELGTSGLVTQESAELAREIVAALDADGAAPVEQERRRLPEILGVRPEQDRLLALRRLEHVVPAGGNETAADEHDLGDRVQLGQLADRVEDDHGVGGFRTWQLAASHRVPPARRDTPEHVRNT